MSTVMVNGVYLTLVSTPPPAEFLELPPLERSFAALLREEGEVRQAAEERWGPGRLSYLPGKGYTWEQA